MSPMYHSILVSEVCNGFLFWTIGTVKRLFLFEQRVYGQFCIETLHESRKRKSSGLFVQISTFTQCIYILVIKV